MVRFLVGWVALGVSVGAAALEFEWQGASEARYGRPHDIVLSPDGARLYVADNTNHRIAVLAPCSLAEVGSFGAGEVGEPHDVVFDAAGRLLVADTRNHRIAIYAVAGNAGRLVGEITGRLRRPEGVDVHPDGRVFATGAASGNLVVFGADGGVLAEKGGFSSPHDVAITPGGMTIWVADANNDRMVALDPALAIRTVLEGPDYGFDGPRYLDFDAAGRLIVADKYTHRVLVIEPAGVVIAILGTGRAGEGPGVFDRPEGVEVRGADVWFSDTYNDRVVRYRMK